MLTHPPPSPISSTPSSLPLHPCPPPAPPSTHRLPGLRDDENKAGPIARPQHAGEGAPARGHVHTGAFKYLIFLGGKLEFGLICFFCFLFLFFCFGFGFGFGLVCLFVCLFMLLYFILSRLAIHHCHLVGCLWFVLACFVCL